MEILNKQIISDNLFIAEVDKLPNEIFETQLHDWLMKDLPFVPWREQLQPDNIEKLKDLKEKIASRFKLRLALIHKNELQGWSFGWQDSEESFYMVASGISPELRRKGLYSILVNRVLESTRQAGFQTVSSRHVLTNNSVIIAKLKLGFTIQGIEVDAAHGTLIRLSYHHNELFKAASRLRVGATDEAKIRNLLFP